jgi:uncharacterized protein (TIGR03435 family)
MRNLIVGVGLLALFSTAGAGQTPVAPAFDVVSIKENTSGNDGGGAGPRGNDRWVATNMPLRSLIAAAWNIPTNRVIAPDWTMVTRYDIDARGSVEQGWDDIRPKTQAALRERFGVEVHVERRNLPTYNLVQLQSGQLGPGLRMSPIKDCLDRQAIAAMKPPPRPCMMTFGTGTLTGTMSIKDLAVTLTGASGRPVFDQTGLAGNYEVDLKWTPTLRDDSSDAVSIFTAVQEQLGLKLEGASAPLDVLIVDRVDRPTPN